MGSESGDSASSGPGPVDLASVRRARRAASDEAAGREIVRRLLPRVRKRVYFLVPSEAEREDLVSQCMVEILDSLRRYRGEASLETWADRICYRVCMRAASRLRRRQATEQTSEQALDVHVVAPGPGPAGDPHDTYVAGQLEGALRRHLDAVPEPRRTAVVLKVLFGHTMKEVAEITGVPLETARSRVKKGLVELRRSAGADPAFLELLGKGPGMEGRG